MLNSNEDEDEIGCYGAGIFSLTSSSGPPASPPQYLIFTPRYQQILQTPKICLHFIAKASIGAIFRRKSLLELWVDTFLPD